MSGPRQLLAAGAARLAAAGVGTPRVDAELLLAAVLGVPRSRLPVIDQVPAGAAARFDEHVGRRAAREPLQHIVGTAPFRHVEVAVGPGVFVPRPETELLVDAVLPHLRALGRPVVVDLCAGSGALALAIADEVPGAQVVAVERSPAALRWLTVNTDGSDVEVLAGDVRDPGLLHERHGQVDVVVSNPPYVPTTTRIEAEARADPGEAVFAGPDGLDLLPAVLARAAQLLRPGGRLALEHDDSHGESVPALVRADGRFLDIADHQDLTGRPRYAVATRR